MAVRASDRRNGITAAAAALVVVAMGGLAYASVPLYQWFCQVTGFGGTTQVADAAPAQVLDRKITVLFNADVNSKLPWTFRPAQRRIELRLGEEGLAFYRARNDGATALTGTATFNVTPPKAMPASWCLSLGNPCSTKVCCNCCVYDVFRGCTCVPNTLMAFHGLEFCCETTTRASHLDHGTQRLCMSLCGGDATLTVNIFR